VDTAPIDVPQLLNVQRRQGPRVLLGIFATEREEENAYWQAQRRLLQAHPDRICPLSSAILPSSCELVYTFVVGANAAGPTTQKSDFLVNQTTSKTGNMDVTRLNIVENTMVDKSQTWFSYAHHHLVQVHGFDYVAKCNLDIFLRLDEWFDFAQQHLPMQTHRRIFAGMFADAISTKMRVMNLKEYLKPKYARHYLYWYALGQFYLFSASILRDVVAEIPNYPGTGNGRNQEDIAMSFIAMKTPGVVELLVLAEKDRFWSQGLPEPALGNFSHRDTALPVGVTSSSFIAPVTSPLIKESPSNSSRRVPPNRPRILMGIFSTMSSRTDARYRSLFRELFQANHPYRDRICPLSNVHDSCELIYTFVLGANPNTTTTEIRTGPDAESFLFQGSVAAFAEDAAEGDYTFLNIRENMDEGKTPTWWAFVSHILQKYELDYAAKCDSDTILLLDGLFGFAETYLPPKTHRRILLGKFSDSMLYQNLLPSGQVDRQRKYLEGKFGSHTLHWFAQGQFYLLSAQLIQDIQVEIANFPGFVVNFEDQVLSMMALKSAGLIELLVLAESEHFWLHKFKLSRQRHKFKAAWEEKLRQITGTPREGEVFAPTPFAITTANSTTVEMSNSI